MNAKLKDRIRNTIIKFWQRSRVTDSAEYVTNAEWKSVGHVTSASPI